MNEAFAVQCKAYFIFEILKFCISFDSLSLNAAVQNNLHIKVLDKLNLYK